MGSRRDCTWILGLPGFRLEGIERAAPSKIAGACHDQSRWPPGYRGRRFTRDRSQSATNPASARRALLQLTAWRTAASLVGMD